jgi:hypothetical protein
MALFVLTYGYSFFGAAAEQCDRTKQHKQVKHFYLKNIFLVMLIVNACRLFYVQYWGSAHWKMLFILGLREKENKTEKSERKGKVDER